MYSSAWSDVTGSVPSSKPSTSRGVGVVPDHAGGVIGSQNSLADALVIY